MKKMFKKNMTNLCNSKFESKTSYIIASNDDEKTKEEQ